MRYEPLLEETNPVCKRLWRGVTLRAYKGKWLRLLSVTMKTYPLIDEKKGDRPFAFEIENAYVGTGTIARLLAEVDGVTDVRARKLFRGQAKSMSSSSI